MNYVRPKGASSPAISAAVPRGRLGKPFSISSLDAFDQLVDRGYAVEFVSQAGAGAASIGIGSRVNVAVTAMTWDGSTTEVLVFHEGNYLSTSSPLSSLF